MRTAARTVQIRRAFAQTVRELRLKAGLSQERLALNLGINRGNLASLERGVHTPRLYTIARLLPGLGVTFVGFVQEFERILKEVITGEAAALPPTRRRHNVDTTSLRIIVGPGSRFPGPK